MKSVFPVLLVGLLCGGCSTLTDQQRTIFKRVVITSLVITAAGAAIDHGHGSVDRHIPTPAVNCTAGACK